MSSLRSKGPLVEEERRAVALRSDLNRAWIAVILLPLFFLLAFGSGYLVSWLLLGDDTDYTHLTAWQVVLVAVPTVVIMLLPCVAAVRYGRRVVRAGRAVGWLPLLIGGTVGIAWTVANLVGAVTSL